MQISAKGTLCDDARDGLCAPNDLCPAIININLSLNRASKFIDRKRSGQPRPKIILC